MNPTITITPIGATTAAKCERHGICPHREESGKQICILCEQEKKP